MNTVMLLCVSLIVGLVGGRLLATNKLKVTLKKLEEITQYATRQKDERYKYYAECLALRSKVEGHERRVYAHRHEMSEFKQGVIDDHKERLKTQRDRIVFLREQNKKLTDDLRVSSELQSVRFTAMVPNVGPVRTEFKLGYGPCGLNVIALRWTEKEDRYEIEQLCSNGERKDFVYMKHDVMGRLEFRRKGVNL